MAFLVFAEPNSIPGRIYNFHPTFFRGQLFLFFCFFYILPDFSLSMPAYSEILISSGSPRQEMKDNWLWFENIETYKSIIFLLNLV